MLFKTPETTTIYLLPDTPCMPNGGEVPEKQLA